MIACENTASKDMTRKLIALPHELISAVIETAPSCSTYRLEINLSFQAAQR